MKRGESQIAIEASRASRARGETRLFESVLRRKLVALRGRVN